MIGKTVYLSERAKQQLRDNGCAEHVDEFGECKGIVESLVDYGSQRGPEVNVRWQPSGLRYSYHPDDLLVTR